MIEQVDPAALEQNKIKPALPGASSLTLVSSGRSWLDQKVLIVDPNTLLAVASGNVGEIWVNGPSVAQGYWQRADETAATFRAHLADTGEGPFLRTGDLGYLNADGELFVTGRLKDLIIIRGHNYYPHDLEQSVEQCHPGLRHGCGAAFSIEVGGEERVVVVQEIERNLRKQKLDEIIAAIRRAISREHELDVYAVVLLLPGGVAKTSSGKLERHASRSAFLAGTLRGVVAEWRQGERDHRSNGHRNGAARRKQSPPTQVVSGSGPSQAAIEEWLCTRLAARLQVSRETIDTRTPFAEFAVNSKDAIGLSGDLEEWLGRRLPATLLYEYPTIEALAAHLAYSTLLEPQPRAAEASFAVHHEEPVAIVGLGCRFPGAENVLAFWRMLCQGVDAIAEVPPDRWNIDEFYSADAKTLGKMNTRWGGFLREIDQFDPEFFQIAPREAARIDPQQRLLLEVAWEALEDAGLPIDRLAGSATGVFIGIASDDYGRMQIDLPDLCDPYASTGSALSIAANRLSYLFDFRGPSMAIDTACSSSLVAVHLAARSLAAGECNVALAGGVNLLLSPAVTVNFSQAGFMAPDGRCKAFDGRANGYVRSEGAGVVVLKRLSQALADGDPIYAIIRGSAVNQDGRSNGLTAPNPKSQEAVLAEACRRAGVAPEQVQYVEAHGTGTQLGDPIEARALAAVLCRDRPADRPLRIGSVKTNIGHLEAAAGIAGLIKLALSLKHRQLPASLHFEEPNRHIDFAELKLAVPTRLETWPAYARPARAGVSAFGFGGTNVHVVLEEPPSCGGTFSTCPDGQHPARAKHTAEEARPSMTGPLESRLQPAESGNRLKPGLQQPIGAACLLPLSAHSDDALRALAARFREMLSAQPAEAPLDDICYTAARRRTHHEHRQAIFAATCGEAVTKLDEFLSASPVRSKALQCLDEATTALKCRTTNVPASLSKGSQKQPVFVFTGQGAHWHGMGVRLYQEDPVFRAAFDRCDELFSPLAGWRLIDELHADQTQSRLDCTEVAQPLLFAIQIGLAALWQSWGIEPAAVVGHSVGEVAAAHVAGAIELEEAVQIVYYRSRLMQRAAGRGRMAALGLGWDDAHEAVSHYNGRLVVAAHNGPTATVVSGETTALDDLMDVVLRRGVFARRLNVNAAFHSPQMQDAQDALVQQLDGLSPRAARIPIYSTVTGRRIEGTELTAEYWGRNLREPVRFCAAVEQLAEVGHACFFELGPHPALSPEIDTCLKRRAISAVVLPSMRRDAGDRSVPLRSLGRLYSLGHNVRWEGVYARGCVVALPLYPFQRKRFWLENPHRPWLAETTSARPPSLSPVEKQQLASSLYEFVWHTKAPEVEAASPPEHWVILPDAGSVATELAHWIETHGGSCTVASGDEVEAALSAARHKSTAVVCLWGLEIASPADDESPSDTAAAVCSRVVELVKRVHQARTASGKPQTDIKLWLATQGAQAVGGHEVPGVFQSPLWGLGRVVAQEQPSLWGGLVDLDAASVAENLYETVSAGDGEDQAAYRNGVRYVGRLVRSADAEHANVASLPLRADGAYLITGGLGDLGLVTARWLVEHGARRLILLGRTPLPPRRQWSRVEAGSETSRRIAAIRELESLGASVHLAAVDMADAAALRRFLDDYRAESWPAIRGVVHAAGVLHDRTLLELTQEQLAEVFRPKLAAWTLARLLADEPLDFFVLFSSAAALWGSPGQANYAAANAFLDTLAHHRRASGQPATAIAWGPWAGVGMAAQSGRGQNLAQRGLVPLEHKAALGALERLLRDGPAHAAVMQVDWRRIGSLAKSRRTPAWLAEVLQGEASSQAGSPTQPEISREACLALPAPQRVARIESWLASEAARVLGIDAQRLNAGQSLAHLGLDSLMAVELHNRIEQVLSVDLPAVRFLQGASVADLAAQLAVDLETTREPGLAIVPRDVPLVDYPLSHNQQALWFLNQLMPRERGLNCSAALRIRDELDVAALERALQRLVERHPALRTTVSMTPEGVRQHIGDGRDVRLERIDAASWSEAELHRRLTEDSNRRFDLEHGPIVRAALYSRAARDHVFLLSIDHLVVDFWSLTILFQEAGELYAAEIAGSPASLPPLETTFGDYVDWQRRLVESPLGARYWEYWRERLSGDLPVLDLPTDRPRPASQTFTSATLQTALPVELASRLAVLAEARGTTLYALLLAAYQTLLCRYAGQSEVMVGSVMSGRTSANLASVVGYLINPVVLRGSIAGNPTFNELVDQTRRRTLEAIEHQDFPIVELARRLKIGRQSGRPPLFQTMFVLQKAQMFGEQGLAAFALGEGGVPVSLGNLQAESVALHRTVGQFDVSLMMAERDGLVASWTYNPDLFDAGTVGRLARHFEQLLTAAADNPDKRVLDLPLLSPEERDQQLARFRGGDGSTGRYKLDAPASACSGRDALASASSLYSNGSLLKSRLQAAKRPTGLELLEAAYGTEVPSYEHAGSSLHELFERRAAQTPEAVALVAEGRQLSYRELDELANHWAGYLRSLGIGLESRVALCAERSPELVIGMLGILKAGGAYVPLDPEYPQERIAFMLADSQAALVLAQDQFRDRLPATVRIEPLGVSPSTAHHSPTHHSPPTTLAYLIYTSGSTGQPKGVMVPHGAIVNHLLARQALYPLAPGDRFLHKASISFDISVWEIFGPLAAGATLVLAPPGAARDNAQLIDAVVSNQITVIHFGPAALRAFLDHPGVEQCTSLQHIFCGGEPLGRQTALDCLVRLPARLHHQYGPTEAAVDVTFFDCDAENLPATIPLGRPIAKTQVYLLDRNLEPAPPGVAGEIYLGGASLARGYVNRPDLTAASFVPDPFSDVPGARLYKTGDLARCVGGELEFLGRSDQQIKLRGFRIELGEIEAALASHPEVKQAMVVPRDDGRGDRRLVGYLLPANGHAPAASLLREHLRRRLPEHMLPSALVTLDRWPLSPSGKIDRRALPAPERQRSAAAYVAPTNEREAALAAIWAQALGVERVGIHDDFFELGGDSIIGMQIIARSQAQGLRFTPKQLFMHPTVAQLTAVASSAPLAIAQQEPVTGPVELTPIQRAFFERKLPDRNQYTQSLLLESDERLDVQRLEQALARIIEHHDALRLRFEQTESGWRQINAGLECIDADSRVVERELGGGDADIEPVAAELHAALNIERGPLVRAALLHCDSVDRSTVGVQASAGGLEKQAKAWTPTVDRLLIVVHHLAVDGVSWRILLEDLWTAYQQLSRGLPVELQPKSTSFQHWSARLLDYAQGAEVATEQGYWLDERRLHVPPLPVDIPAVDLGKRQIGELPQREPGDAEPVCLSFSRDETARLVQERTNTFRARLDDLLLAGVAMSFRSAMGLESVLVDLEGHGREDMFPDVDLSRTVGWFTSLYPVLLSIPEDDSPAAVLRAVKQQLAEVPRRGIGYGLLRYLRDDAELHRKLAELPAAQVAFNFLGQFDAIAPQLGPLRLAGRPRNPVGAYIRPHPIEITGYIHQGELQLQWEYDAGLHRRATIERLCRHFEAAVQALLECGQSGAAALAAADFPAARLDQKQLERFLSKVGKKPSRRG